jgi:hypothetical protein
VSGTLFLAVQTGTSIECYLLVGGSLQSIGAIVSRYTGAPNALTAFGMATLSNVTSFGPYALFMVTFSVSTNPILYAYDAVRGALYSANAQWAIPAQGNAAVIAAGLNAINGADWIPAGVNAAWSVAMINSSGVATTAQVATFGISNASSIPIKQPGRVISSLVDFTSAQVKLYRQIIVTHPAIPAGGTVQLAVYLDVNPDVLPATTTLNVTNTTTGATTTRILINTLATKLVYVLDYTSGSATVSAPLPITVVVQAATGWIWKIHFALSESARLNSQQSNTFCFQQQGIDAKAGYNFLRQLWRTKGGQCLATFPDGDQYNAAIESIEFTSPKPLAVTMSGDRKNRYEVIAAVTIREDL